MLWHEMNPERLVRRVDKTEIDRNRIKEDQEKDGVILLQQLHINTIIYVHITIILSCEYNAVRQQPARRN